MGEGIVGTQQSNKTSSHPAATWPQQRTCSSFWLHYFSVYDSRIRFPPGSSFPLHEQCKTVLHLGKALGEGGGVRPVSPHGPAFYKLAELVVAFVVVCADANRLGCYRVSSSASEVVIVISSLLFHVIRLVNASRKKMVLLRQQN